MLADILPTGYEVGVLNGTVQPGDVSPSSAPADRPLGDPGRPPVQPQTSSRSTWQTPGWTRRRVRRRRPVNYGRQDPLR